MHITYLILTIAILAGINYTIAQTSSPDPGHGADMVGPGEFYGAATDIWSFPGSVGIGTTSPGEELDVLGDAHVSGNITIDSDLTAAGDVTANAFYYSSDRNLKENICEIPDALDRVLEMEGVSFEWKDSGQQSIGLVAQDVEKVFPELVSTNPETGLKSIQYGNLVAVLIEAIKEQQSQIQELQSELESLK